jgi:hypothetical protein
MFLIYFHNQKAISGFHVGIEELRKIIGASIRCNEPYVVKIMPPKVATGLNRVVKGRVILGLIIECVGD